MASEATRALAAAIVGFAGLAAGAPPSDGADCGGFSAADAAAWLKVPAAAVTRTVQKSGDRLWLCAFAAGKPSPAIAFSVEVAPSAGAAAAQMERYRENLMTTGDLPQYRDKLPKGAYSDIVGPGDEGVWTDINGAYTVRKGRVMLQFTRPREKLEQVRLGKSIVDRF